MTALLISGTTKASTLPLTLAALATMAATSVPLGGSISARITNSPEAQFSLVIASNSPLTYWDERTMALEMANMSSSMPNDFT